MLKALEPGDPEQVGPYRLQGVLGSGGFGRVFLGRSADSRLVAVKVIRPDLAADPEFRERFRREVAAARKVSGRFTAQVIDADTESPAPWQATVYVPGLSLAETVALHGPLSVSKVLALAAGLTKALAEIHAAGLVHRDLKPGNVILAEDGPRVIDFGIVRAAGASTLTGTGAAIGTPGFMSPEQVRSDEVGPPSDVFSLGSVLVFAATGQGPFGTGSAAELLYRVAHETPSLDQVPQEIRPLVRRCLAAEPGHRPTLGDLLADLRPAKPAVGRLSAPVTPDTEMHGDDAANTIIQRSPTAGIAVLKISAVAAVAVVAVTLAAVYAAGHFIIHEPAPTTSTPAPTRTSPAHSTRQPRAPRAAHTSAPLPLAGWSAGQQVDADGAFVSVSCASADFCMAADSGGNIYTYSDGAWSQPRQLDSGGLTSVSCPTSGFCVATSNSNNVYTYTDGTWSPPSQLVGADGNPANLTWVSCPAAGLCMATGDWDTYTYSGGRWAQGHLVQDANTLVSVSCASADFCMAADSGGNIYTYSAT
jgi:serine/threonine protein kinase